MSLAFLLVLIGYGTKIGLAPMHTWLPDAHSEGSGAGLGACCPARCSIRPWSASSAISPSPTPPASRRCARGPSLIALGAFSLLVAALFIVRQKGVKRLMAYSSVEHMGVIALGFGFGGPLGVAGALYHMLNHSLNKSAMFFGAGAVMRAYQTKRIPGIRRVLTHFPRPRVPLARGRRRHHRSAAVRPVPERARDHSRRAGGVRNVVVGLFAVLLVVIFVGFLNQFRIMVFENGNSDVPDVRVVTPWMIAPMALSIAPLLVMGLWWPQAFWDLFQTIAQSLGALPAKGTAP